MNKIQLINNKYNIRNKNFKKKLYLINSKNKIFGKLIILISNIITGKYKYFYKKYYNIGDRVYLINTDLITFSSKKYNKKIYYKHSGYPGGLKILKLKDLFIKKRDFLIKNSLRKILKKNKIRRKLIKNLSFKYNIKNLMLKNNFKILNI